MRILLILIIFTIGCESLAIGVGVKVLGDVISDKIKEEMNEDIPYGKGD